MAEFMERALYHPEYGYYTSASRRSGRSGDFFTSVDVGPLFGALLAAQIAEMWRQLRERGAAGFHLVEAGAGDGRLTRDMLDATAKDWPELYEALHVTLVERSPTARARHAETLGRHAQKLDVASASTLPGEITGAIVGNELLDALPVHVVVMTAAGLREVHVGESRGALVEVLFPASSPDIQGYLEGPGVPVPAGVRAEIGLAGAEWMEEAARSVRRGFLLLIDYGHEAVELYSGTHAAGTLAAYRGHATDTVNWLESAGSCDMTAHVNLTAIRLAAAGAGLTPLGLVDQTYFLLALGLMERLDAGQTPASIRRRLAARTLIDPAGLGGTMKVMAFGKDVGAPQLTGFARGRVT
jgi:SAM-dependent MidA family methyltransferase